VASGSREMTLEDGDTARLIAPVVVAAPAKEEEDAEEGRYIPRVYVMNTRWTPGAKTRKRRAIVKREGGLGDRDPERVCRDPPLPTHRKALLPWMLLHARRNHSAVTHPPLSHTS
jgi:hypothetical protein